MSNAVITFVVALLIGLVAVTAGVNLIQGRSAETPEVFAASAPAEPTGEADATADGTSEAAASGGAAASLDEALARAEAESRPVLVVVTADWCPPCQRLKRDTLSDPEVGEFIAANFIPLHLEDGANREDIQRLPIRAFPTTMVINSDGELVQGFEGYAPADAYTSQLSGVLSGLPQG